jgi:large subunit ribosomal protein L9
MKVLLRSDVKGVGRRGDIVDVAGGFARNFLLPGGHGIEATAGVEAQATAMRRSRDLREAQDRQSAEAQVKILEGAVIRIEARAGKADRLFGSVSVADVAEAVLAQKGVELDRHGIALEEPIKTIGTYEIPVHLFGDISVKLSVEVVAAG